MVSHSTRSSRKDSKQIAARSVDLRITSGYGASRYNATRHGIFSKSKVLKWENEEEYNALEQSFIDEYQPVGVTERVFTLELAWITWRKKRVRLAEHAALNDGLREAVEQGDRTANATIAYTAKRVKFDGDTFKTAFDISPELLDLNYEEFHNFSSGTFEAAHMLAIASRSGFGNDEDTIGEALAHLPAMYRDEIRVARKQGDFDLEDKDEEEEEGEESLAAALENFIRTTFYPRLLNVFAGLQVEEGLAAQAIGSAMFSDELPKILGYEARLDRKFEKTLAMLVRLQEIRESRERKKLNGSSKQV